MTHETRSIRRQSIFHTDALTFVHGTEEERRTVGVLVLLVRHLLGGELPLFMALLLLVHQVQLSVPQQLEHRVVRLLEHPPYLVLYRLPLKRSVRLCESALAPYDRLKIEREEEEGGKRTAGVTHLLIQQVVRKPAQINLHVLLGAKLPSVRLRGFSVQIDAKQ